jgi:hypothetical protein
VIVKTLFLAETFIAMERNSFRDHESRPAEYPDGYLLRGGRFSRVRTIARKGVSHVNEWTVWGGRGATFRSGQLIFVMRRWNVMEK